MSIKPPAHKPQHSIQAPHPVLIMQDRHLHRTPRTTEVGRDLWRPSGSTPLPWQWRPWQGAQEHIKTAFEGLQGGETQLSVWKTLIVTHTAKKCFLDVQRESSVFQFVHITSCPGYRHRQELSSTFLTPSLQALQKNLFWDHGWTITSCRVHSSLFMDTVLISVIPCPMENTRFPHSAWEAALNKALQSLCWIKFFFSSDPSERSHCSPE